MHTWNGKELFYCQFHIPLLSTFQGLWKKIYLTYFTATLPTHARALQTDIKLTTDITHFINHHQRKFREYYLASLCARTHNVHMCNST